MISKENILISHEKSKGSIPWREVFKEEIAKYGEGSLVLRGLRIREDMTQKQLAEIIGVSPHHISEMENNKRPIGSVPSERKWLKGSQKL